MKKPTKRLVILHFLYRGGLRTTQDVARQMDSDTRVAGAYLWALEKEGLVQSRCAGLARPFERMKEWRVKPSRKAEILKILQEVGYSMEESRDMSEVKVA